MSSENIKGEEDYLDKNIGIFHKTEKFEDGSEFRIKFKVSDIIKLSKDKPIIESSSLLLKMLLFRGGRKHDLDENGFFSGESKKRMNKANMEYPIIIAQNSKGIPICLLDGTHRLEKAFENGVKDIKVRILQKEELKQFKTEEVWNV